MPILYVDANFYTRKTGISINFKKKSTYHSIKGLLYITRKTKQFAAEKET